MPPHRFALGEHVTYEPAALDQSSARGSYVITRVLPGDDFGRTYRARSARDGVERVFREAQLQPGAKPPG